MGLRVLGKALAVVVGTIQYPDSLLLGAIGIFTVASSPEVSIERRNGSLQQSGQNSQE